MREKIKIWTYLVLSRSSTIEIHTAHSFLVSTAAMSSCYSSVTIPSTSTPFPKRKAPHSTAFPQVKSSRMFPVPCSWSKAFIYLHTVFDLEGAAFELWIAGKGKRAQSGCFAVPFHGLVFFLQLCEGSSVGFEAKLLVPMQRQLLEVAFKGRETQA